MVDVIYFLGMRLEYWSLIIAGIALTFTALKEFILPWFFKPELQFSYLSKEPYKRQTRINRNTICFFDRLKIENIGRQVAKNCRCQIYSIKNSKNQLLDFSGFPLRWASRPESATDFIRAERLNIAPGEVEFTDLIYVRLDQTNKIMFSPYHNVPIGMPDNIDLEDYTIEVIISGDNFRPYIVEFKITRDSSSFQLLKLKLVRVKRK